MREETTEAWNAIAEVLGTNFQHEYMQQSLRDRLSQQILPWNVRKRKMLHNIRSCHPLIAAPMQAQELSPDSKP